MPADLTQPQHLTVAQAYWNQREKLARSRQRILALSRAIGRPGDFSLYQWAQISALALEFAPDLILELGRGMGNSTSAFTEVANLLGAGSCRVLSLDLTDAWDTVALPRLRPLVPEDWFLPLSAIQADILQFDFEAALAGAHRPLVFWDAHGFEVAECVLGRVLPLLAEKPHLVVMHDMSDARYQAPDTYNYGESGLWKGDNAAGQYLFLGSIISGVAQAIAILDFSTRNRLPLHSADDELHNELEAQPDKLVELERLLGKDLFSLQAHWAWFTLAEAPGPCTFPRLPIPDALLTNAVEPKHHEVFKNFVRWK